MAGGTRVVVGGAARRALVTGGAGFVGSHVVDELLREGWRVRVLDDFSTGRESHLASVGDRIEILRADVRDEQALAAATDGVEVVFHQAAIASVPRSLAEPVHTHEVNLGGSLAVLEAARRQGCRRVVLASSSAVYGDGNAPPLGEHDTTRPISPYGVQKLAAEHYARLYATVHGVETVALRYFNVYGERQDPNGDYAAVIPRFLDAARRGTPIRIHGDGAQTRDFIHVSDVARANRLAADAPSASGRCFNVASGRGTRVVDLASRVAEVLEREPRIVHEPARVGDVRRSWAKVEAAREKLGFEPRVDLVAGLRGMVGWMTAASDGPGKARRGGQEIREVSQ